jgi:hypothetical protein
MAKLFTFLFWIAVIILLLYELFFGSLLFLNPIKLGLRSKKLKRATIYTSNLYTINPIYDFVDDYMNNSEEIFHLGYTGNVNIYVSSSANEFKRWVPPWIGKNVGGVTLYFGNVIFINPETINKNKYSEEEFIKHELIHNLMYQHSALLAKFVFSQQEWVMEGLSSYYGGPNYLSENEFRSMMRNNKLEYGDTSTKLFTNLDSKDYKFKMSVYKYLFVYLVNEYDDTLMRSFLKQYLESPGNYRLIFFEVYNKPMKVVIDDFKKEYGGL